MHTLLTLFWLIVTGVLQLPFSVLSYAEQSQPATTAPDIRVTLLGTGTPAPNPRQFGQSILVEAGGEQLLFDCGRGCSQRLWNIGPEFLKNTTHLFFSHLHSDHTTGTAGFFIGGWVLGRDKDLEVFGPKKGEELIRYTRMAYEQDVILRVDKQHSNTRQGLDYRYTEVRDGFVFELNGVKVTAIRVDHGVIEEAFGYRIDYAGRSVVISGDTAYSQNLIENSMGVDVMIHEVMSPALEAFIHKLYSGEKQKIGEDIIALHTLAPDVGRVFTKTGTRFGVFTHLNNDPAQLPELIKQTRSTWSGPLVVGEDLMVIEIGKEIQVKRP